MRSSSVIKRNNIRVPLCDDFLSSCKGSFSFCIAMREMSRLLKVESVKPTSCLHSSNSKRDKLGTVICYDDLWHSMSHENASELLCYRFTCLVFQWFYLHPSRIVVHSDECCRMAPNTLFSTGLAERLYAFYKFCYIFVHVIYYRFLLPFANAWRHLV